MLERLCSAVRRAMRTVWPSSFEATFGHPEKADLDDAKKAPAGAAPWTTPGGCASRPLPVSERICSILAIVLLDDHARMSLEQRLAMPLLYSAVKAVGLC